MTKRIIVLTIFLISAVIAALIEYSPKEKLEVSFRDRHTLVLSGAYQANYIGEVMPTPQRAEYFDTDIDVTKTRIHISHQAMKPIHLGSEELANRIAFLGGDKPKIEEAPAMPRHCVLILPAYASANAAGRLARAFSFEAPKRKEAYMLRVTDIDNMKAIVIVGNDALGAYWGCQSLLQLMRQDGGSVKCRDMVIYDYPAFGLRSFKIGGSYSAIDIFGKWCPTVKFNTFNVCYTSIGPDKWPNPDEDYCRMIDRLAAFLLPRGLDIMIFVNPYYSQKTPFEISNPEDLNKLIETSSIGLKLGSRKVMLCLDDFASKPHAGSRLFILNSETDRKKFRDDLALAHVSLFNQWYRALKNRFPLCELFAVPSYYWTPTGSYKDEAERYLRKIGVSLPKELTLVWTGPVIRSKVITRKDVEHQMSLIGRKLFLWDNTIYAWHDPPDYFLDPFKTKYPEGFWNQVEKGCQYNAAPSEAYRVGIMCISDYLWNPAAYEPEKSLRKAIRIVAGDASLNALLEFRDAYFRIREHYIPALTRKEDLSKLISEESCLTDTSYLNDVKRLFASGDRLIAQIKSECGNQALVQEVESRWASLSAIRHAFDELSLFNNSDLGRGFVYRP